MVEIAIDRRSVDPRVRDVHRSRFDAGAGRREDGSVPGGTVRSGAGLRDCWSIGHWLVTLVLVLIAVDRCIGSHL